MTSDQLPFCQIHLPCSWHPCHSSVSLETCESNQVVQIPCSLLHHSTELRDQTRKHPPAKMAICSIISALPGRFASVCLFTSVVRAQDNKATYTYSSWRLGMLQCNPSRKTTPLSLVSKSCMSHQAQLLTP